MSFNETVSFQPASSTAPLCVDIIVVNDTILENDETFAVRLSSSDEDVTVESQDATVTISDDDGIQIECYNYIWSFFILVCTLVGIVIPGFSQATFEVDEDTILELCVDVSSASLERSVVLSLTTVEATAQGTAGTAFVVVLLILETMHFFSLRTVS